MITQPTVSRVSSPLSGTHRHTRFRIPLALGMASFVSALVFVTPPPLFDGISRDLGISIPALGQIMTVMLFAASVLSLVIGPLADRHGVRRLLIIGAGASAVCMLGFGIAPNCGVLLGAALLGGLANATLPGLSLAVARSTLDWFAWRRGIGWSTAGSAVSAVVAVPLMTLLGGAMGWRTAFIVAAGVAGGVTALLVRFLPNDPDQPSGTSSPQSLLAAYAPLVRHRPTVQIYTVTVLRSLCWFGLLGYFGAFMGEGLGLSGSWIGAAYMLGGSGFVIGSLTASHLFQFMSPRRMIGVTNVTLGVTVALMFGVVQGPIGAVGLMTVAGFMGAFSHIGTVTLLSVESPGGSGTVMVLNGALANLGAAGGGALGGILLATGGYSMLGIGLGAIGVFTVMLLFRSTTLNHAPEPLGAA